MNDNLLYHERVTSNKTEVLFLVLTILFIALLIWHVSAESLDIHAVVLFIFFVIFLFYSMNYRTFIIRLTPEALKLTFGIFTWTVALDDIESCRIDNLTPLERYGGAGIHFMMVRGRYRVNFNFLEYPRLVVALKRKSGLVKDVSFSTQKPGEILGILPKATLENQATPNTR
jgi:ABC-type multidrug transport system fused ATPase/permease subunit